MTSLQLGKLTCSELLPEPHESTYSRYLNCCVVLGLQLACNLYLWGDKGNQLHACASKHYPRLEEQGAEAISR